ncbi:IS110 family transposase [Streptomyces sp. NPDC055092]
MSDSTAAAPSLTRDSDLVKAIAVLGRAQQDAVWDRTRAHNRLRSHLREYYPAILEAFAAKRERLLCREACTILAIAPTPAEAARHALMGRDPAVHQPASGRQRAVTRGHRRCPPHLGALSAQAVHEGGDHSRPLDPASPAGEWP